MGYGESLVWEWGYGESLVWLRSYSSGGHFAQDNVEQGRRQGEWRLPKDHRAHGRVGEAVPHVLGAVQ